MCKKDNFRFAGKLSDHLKNIWRRDSYDKNMLDYDMNLELIVDSIKDHIYKGHYTKYYTKINDKITIKNLKDVNYDNIIPTCKTILCINGSTEVMLYFILKKEEKILDTAINFL